MNGLVRTHIDYEQLVEVIGDAIVVSDANGAINLWNPAAECLFRIHAG
jgi:PAS domain-containing protein